MKRNKIELEWMRELSVPKDMLVENEISYPAAKLHREIFMQSLQLKPNKKGASHGKDKMWRQSKRSDHRV